MVYYLYQKDDSQYQIYYGSTSETTKQLEENNQLTMTFSNETTVAIDVYYS
jgi:hypothetical protein